MGSAVLPRVRVLDNLLEGGFVCDQFLGFVGVLSGYLVQKTVLTSMYNLSRNFSQSFYSLMPNCQKNRIDRLNSSAAAEQDSPGVKSPGREGALLPDRKGDVVWTCFGKACVCTECCVAHPRQWESLRARGKSKASRGCCLSAMKNIADGTGAE